MRTVEDHLVTSVSVDGAHDTALDRSVVIQSLCHRSQAVGGARCSRDDLVVCCQSFVVYIVNDGRQIVTSRSRNNNLLCTCINVSLCLFLRSVETCAFQNNVNTNFAPRQFSSFCLCIDGQGLTINSDSTCFIISRNSVLVFADSACVTALCGIILQQVSEHRRLGQVVDSNNLITFSTEHLSECETADPAKSINSNFN